MRLRFDGCVLDTAARELRRGGQVRLLSAKSYHLLEILVERRPEAIAHEALRRLLWPDTVAGGTTLARLVHEVRTALGDPARSSRMVRTVHRFGYAFRATTIQEPSSAPVPATKYALQWGTRQVHLTLGENIIGRAADACVSVASSRVSRRHARIIVTGGGATIEDLGSKNGTRVDEQLIDGPINLSHGDRIVIGPVLLIFRASRDEPSTSTGREHVRSYPRRRSSLGET